jgi:succinoglycan biosynthesis transport protein ExoP
MDSQGLTLQELIGILRRRGVLITATVLAVAAAALPAAFLWPAVYRSTATILIEDQEIPRELVRSTVTSLADERIQVISQQIMTRATLMQIVEKYALYENERRYLTNEEVLDRMRRDVRVETINAEGAGRFGGRGAAIAFKLSYDNREPAKAQQVANELVTLYLNENVRARRQRADEATTFFTEEAARIGRQIAEIEAKLAVFKKANSGRLPELLQMNMQMRDRAQDELDDLERQLRMLEDRRVYLESQLTLLKANAPLPAERTLDPEERLRLLRNQYASQSGVYGETHPDLVRMRREIGALEKSTGDPAKADPKALEEARNELGALTERYSADHPDVVRQKKRLAALEAEAAKAPEAKKPDNPAYVSLASQIESARLEAQSLKSRREELRERVASYNARLEQTPSVEQVYRDLTRDHENALAKYKEIRSKQMEAQVALELEKDRKGERFSLIDPPQYPERPTQPNRSKLLALAFLGSAGAGAGAATLVESLNRSVKSARSLATLLDAPLLGVVPRARTAEERSRRRRRIVIACAVLGALVLAAAAFTHFFVMPLDTLWYVLLRRLQL